VTYGVVVVVDPNSDFALPAGALSVLRNASAVYGGSDVDIEALGVERVVEVEKLFAEPAVLIVASVEEPAAKVLLAAGAQLISAGFNEAGAASRPSVGASNLLDAVAVMDKLRSPVG